MLQSSGNNYFSYEPVLKVLQQLENSGLPFTNYICKWYVLTNIPCLFLVFINFL
jgi:hypothetical protein